jgi:glycosyltransferase involved in cell wall biosynthesis
MRPCMLSFYFQPTYSGSSVQAKNLSFRLRALGIDPLIVSANLSGSRPIDELEGLPIRRLPLIKRENLQILSFWLSLILFLISKRRSIDLIHAHGTMQHSIASIVGRLLGKPTILKIAMANSDIAFAGQGRLWGRINRYLVSRFDCYIATSSAIRDECLKIGLDQFRIHSIPNGVDTDTFRPAPSEEARSALRQRFGLGDQQIVCFVGVLDARKNVDGILRVWKLVQERIGTGHLLLIGPLPRGEEKRPGAFFRNLLTYVSDNNLDSSVTFAGQQVDVSSYLRCANIFLFPSRREGMPNALLEAMASGLACVASDVAGANDLLRHGENGFLFDVDDESGMADAIRRLLADPRAAASVGAKARDTIVQNYSLDATAQRYAELYKTLLDRRAART